MSRARLLGLVAVLCAAAAYAAAPAAARPPSGPLSSYPEKLETAHFAVHYTGDLDEPHRILQQTAGDLAANAERAYELLVTTWGLPAPVNDGDGKVDIWVEDLSLTGALGLAYPEGAAQTTGWISIDASAATDMRVIAHEVMHVVQFAMWIPADDWLMEATAEWAGLAANDYKDIEGTDAAPDMSLDCDSEACGNDDYEIGGYSRWGFFQYLSERFGGSIVKDIFMTGAKHADPSKKGRDLVAETLAGKGTSLTSVFNDYTAAHAAGAYTVVGMKDVAPATYTSIALKTVTSALPVTRVGVNHLAARYVKIVRDASEKGQCYAATLALTVALPAGSASVPSFFAKSVGTKATPFNVSGSTASLTVPWTTCAVDGSGYLALPNPSLTADGQFFTVSGTLTVTNVSATPPSTPPLPKYTGPSVPAPTGEVPPSILVHGAELIRVPASTRAVRLLVFSSGSGQLRVTVGDLVLAVATLRAGNNDIRFVLPAATLKGLRRVKSASATTETILSLTSLSTQGAAGETVTRKLAVVQPKKKK